MDENFRSPGVCVFQLLFYAVADEHLVFAEVSKSTEKFALLAIR